MKMRKTRADTKRHEVFTISFYNLLHYHINFCCETFMPKTCKRNDDDAARFKPHTNTHALEPHKCQTMRRGQCCACLCDVCGACYGEIASSSYVFTVWKVGRFSYANEICIERIVRSYDALRCMCFLCSARGCASHFRLRRLCVVSVCDRFLCAS